MLFIPGFFGMVHWLLALKLKIIPNDLVKQKILAFFFAGTSEESFQKKCDLFSEKRLPELIRPGAMEEISRLKTLGFDIVVISASAGNWIRNWSDSHALKLISSKLEVKNGMITGKLDGKNCYGEQKVICILERWNLKEYEEIYAYGDSSGDRPMLALATKSFYRPFRST